MITHSIEMRLNELVPDTSDLLFQAARYSLLAPGKRLRPRLVLTAAKSLGAPLEAALDPACAIEMIHTYSLIHDDLPCMDDDDLRRGRPSLHKVYGEAMALLAGDYLLTYAFEVLAQAKGLSPEQKIDLIQTLSRSAGGAGMVGGQAIDIGVQGQTIDEATLERMHIGKTASLFTACLEFGAIIAGAPAATRSLLRQIGQQTGLAYQILDDILDETGPDSAKGKPTAVSLYGLSGAKQKLESLKGSTGKGMAGFPNELQELLHTLLR